MLNLSIGQWSVVSGQWSVIHPRIKQWQWQWQRTKDEGRRTKNEGAFMSRYDALKQ
jgi:hypothetical protein